MTTTFTQSPSSRLAYISGRQSNGTSIPFKESVPSSPSLASHWGGGTTKSTATQSTTVPGSPVYTASERLLSSKVVHEEIIGPMDLTERVRYVEVPVYEDVIRTVPRKEIIDIERTIPYYTYPPITWVQPIQLPNDPNWGTFCSSDHYVPYHIPAQNEMPIPVHYYEAPMTVPPMQFAPSQSGAHSDIPQRVQMAEEPRISLPKVERAMKPIPPLSGEIRESPVEPEGDVVEVPQKLAYEPVHRGKVEHKPCVVAQTLYPIIKESETEVLEVEMREFNPYLIPIDVIVPRPIARQVTAEQKTDRHKRVAIPAAQYKALIREANPTLSEEEIEYWYSENQNR